MTFDYKLMFLFFFKQAYHENVSTSSLDVHVAFEDVKVECRGEKASVTVPLVTMAGQKTVTYPSPEKLVHEGSLDICTPKAKWIKKKTLLNALVTRVSFEKY